MRHETNPARLSLLSPVSCLVSGLNMPRTCRQCGTPIPAAAPGSECPVCLVSMSLLTARVAVRPPPSPAELQPHFPKLRIVEYLGRGGMGVVYRAEHVELNRPVALKLLAPERAADPALAERFVREAQALARLSHPNIVAVHDVGRAADTVYLVMEYVDGGSLKDRLAADRLSPAEALRLIPALCDAIQYAHDQGVVHRDIKPGNILLAGKDEGGRMKDESKPGLPPDSSFLLPPSSFQPKIADFGLAKFDGGGDLSLTGTGAGMGTAGYMAPEQRTNAATADHRADIYSLGVLFYELLTGELPTPQCRPPSAKAGTDRRLDRVVSRSLKEEPAERYQRAKEMGSDVERIAASRPRPWWVQLAVVAVLVGVVVAVALWPRPVSAPAPADILTSPDWAWSPPENLGPGVNTEQNEGSPSVSADGLTLVFSSDRPGGLGGNDIWSCRRDTTAEPFGDPVNLGPAVNKRGNDIDPWLSGDGRTLLFVTQRRESPLPDVWQSRRSDIGEWGPAESLGLAVNSPAAEYRPVLTEDGRTLTFTSLRPPKVGQPGRSDIWVCRRPAVGDPFGPAEPLSAESHRQQVGTMAFAANGQVVVCNRKDAAYPGDLLWIGRVESAADPLGKLVSFGPAVNGSWLDVNPAATADGTAVYFQSDRPGGAGGTDLWVTRRVRK
jgi:serine/threonine protein kinase